LNLGVAPGVMLRGLSFSFQSLHGLCTEVDRISFDRSVKPIFYKHNWFEWGRDIEAPALQSDSFLARATGRVIGMQCDTIRFDSWTTQWDDDGLMLCHLNFVIS